MEHLRPILIQFPILLDQPGCFLCAGQMRWVKYHQRERVIWERQVCKITYHIRVDVQCAIPGVLPEVVILLPALIAVHSCWMVLIEPDRPCAARHIKDFLFHEASPSPPSSESVRGCSRQGGLVPVPPQCAALPLQNIQGLTPFR